MWSFFLVRSVYLSSSSAALYKMLSWYDFFMFWLVPVKLPYQSCMARSQKETVTVAHSGPNERIPLGEVTDLQRFLEKNKLPIFRGFCIWRHCEGTAAAVDPFTVQWRLIPVSPSVTMLTFEYGWRQNESVPLYLLGDVLPYREMFHLSLVRYLLQCLHNSKYWSLWTQHFL
jgi:hypothetical protein